MYRKKYTSEFRTYKENKYKENKKLNKGETKPISTKFVVQLMMTTKLQEMPIHKAVCLEMCRLGTLSTSLHTHQLFVSDTKYCWLHIVRMGK
jgi:hypothetical protein